MSNAEHNLAEQDDQATIRRAPKMAVFLVVGGGVGAIVTFILTALFPVDAAVGFGPLFGYFLLYGVPAGVVLGAVVALILDRRSRRRQTAVTVEHESVVEAEALDFDDETIDDETIDPDVTR